LENDSSIVDGCINFKAVANDPGVLKQSLPVCFFKRGYFPDVEIVKSPPEILMFVEYGSPAQARLVNFQDKTFKEFVIRADRETIHCIMIPAMHVVIVEPADYIAVRGGMIHMPISVFFPFAKNKRNVWKNE
jgi:hypothetical protein